MKKKAKIILLAVVLAIISISVIVKMSSSVEVDFYEVANGKSEMYFVEKGIVKSEDEYSIYSLVTGEVEEVFVEEGQRVNAGDEIMKIDTQNIALDLQKLNAERDGLLSLKANLDIEEQQRKDALDVEIEKLKSQLAVNDLQKSGTNKSLDEQIRLQEMIIEQNKKMLEHEKAYFDVYAILYENGAIAKKDYEDAKLLLDSYETEYNASLLQLELIKASGNGLADDKYFETMQTSLNKQIANLENSKKKNITEQMKNNYDSQIKSLDTSIAKIEKLYKSSNVVSDVDGVIETLYVKDGVNYISTGSKLVDITSDDKVISTYVSIKDVGELSVGDSVDIIMAKRDKDDVYNGEIVNIKDKAEVKTSSMGIDERKVEVLVKPENNFDDLKIGYDFDVKFYLYEKDNVLTIPTTATFKEDGNVYVFKYNNGKLEKTTIETGNELRGSVEVRTGLAEGDLVVKDSNDKDLKDKLKVNIKK